MAGPPPLPLCYKGAIIKIPRKKQENCLELWEVAPELPKASQGGFRQSQRVSPLTISYTLHLDTAVPEAFRYVDAQMT